MTTFPLQAKLGGEAAGFMAVMGGATRQLNAFAGSAGLATGAMGALAGAAAMGAAVKMAASFQAEMVKLNTLVGISAEEVDQWADAIMRLAPAVGQAPEDLARAMFAITSGGARGAEAMALLEQAAKASAIGLGDMTDIGRAATAALQAFGDTGLTAQKAIDVMVATVRAGNLEASELAGAMGKAMGVAAAMGVSFEDLGAFIATYTRLGVSAREATTALRAVMLAVMNPTEEARQAFDDVGISIDEMRDKLKDDGLAQAMNDLLDATGGNLDMIAALIPNVRALAGALGTSGVQAEAFVQITNDVNEALGLTNDGFETTTDTAQFTMKQFGAQLKVFAITVGDLLLPPLGLLLEVLTSIIWVVDAVVDGIWKLNEAAAGVLEWAFSTGPKEFWEGIKEVVGLAAEETIVYQRTIEDVIASLDRLTGEQLQALQSQLRSNLPLLQEKARLEGEAGEEARTRLTLETELLREVNQEMRERLTLTLDLSDAGEDVDPPATEEQIQELQSLTDALEDELLALEEGERAVLEKRLATLKATEAQRDYVLSVYDMVEAEKEAAAAAKEAQREKEAAARAAERAAEAAARAAEREEKAERRKRERAEKQAEQNRQRQAEAREREAERRWIAQIESDMRRLEQTADNMAQAVTNGLEAWAFGSAKFVDAVRQTVTEILLELARLQIQEAIIGPLADFFFGALGGIATSVGGVSAVPNPGVIPANPPIPGPTTVPDMGTPGGMGFSVPNGGLAMAASGAQGAGGAVVVHQTLNFSPNLIDGRTGTQFLRENAGQIAALVADAARNSTAMRQQLTGG